MTHDSPADGPAGAAAPTLVDLLDDLGRSAAFVEHYTELLRVAKERVDAKKRRVIDAMVRAEVESVSHGKDRYWLKRASHLGKPVDLGVEPCVPAGEVVLPGAPARSLGDAMAAIVARDGRAVEASRRADAEPRVVCDLSGAGSIAVGRARPVVMPAFGGPAIDDGARGEC